MKASLRGELVEIWHKSSEEPEPEQWVKDALDSGMTMAKHDVIVKHTNGNIEIFDNIKALKELNLLSAPQVRVMMMKKVRDAELLKVKNGFETIDAWQINPEEEPIGWLKTVFDKEQLYWDELPETHTLILKSPGFYLGAIIGPIGYYLVNSGNHFRMLSERDFHKQYQVVEEA